MMWHFSQSPTRQLHHLLVLPIGWALIWQNSFTAAAEEAINTTDSDVVTPEYKYNCVTPCEAGTFCGRDLTCHPYSCENWYMYGHPDLTGYTPDKSPSTLDCQLMQQDRSFLTEDQFCRDGNLPVAVSFSLDSCYSDSGCPYDSSGPPVARMNRKCTTTPGDGNGFVCYDIAPDTNMETYFKDYDNATKDLVSLPCAEFNETIAQSHTYHVEVASTVTSPQIGINFGFSSAEFNVTLASKAVVAKLFEVKLDYEMFPLLCKDGCRETEFCGQDGTCHEFNCVNLYDYGPKSATGHDYQDSSTPKLQCFNEPPTVDDSNPCLPDSAAAAALDTRVVNSMTESPWPLLIRYYCTRQENSTKGLSILVLDDALCAYEYLDGRYATFNRHCFAQPNPYQNFSCYDLQPNTNLESYLATYVNKTTLNSECTMDNLPYPYEPGPDEPENATITYPGRHSYQTCIQGGNRTTCALYGAVGDKSLKPLDYERLRFVMRSRILGELPEGYDGSSSSSSSSTMLMAGIAILASVPYWLVFCCSG